MWGLPSVWLWHFFMVGHNQQDFWRKYINILKGNYTIILCVKNNEWQIAQKCQNLNFKFNSLCQESTSIQKFREHIFVKRIFWQTFIFETLYFYYNFSSQKSNDPSLQKFHYQTDNNRAPSYVKVISSAEQWCCGEA